jgi:hypothetical protein
MKSVLPMVVGVGVLAGAAGLVVTSLGGSREGGDAGASTGASETASAEPRPDAPDHVGPLHPGVEVAGRTITALECTEHPTVRITLGRDSEAVTVEVASPDDDAHPALLGRTDLLVFYAGAAPPTGFEEIGRALIDLVHREAPDDAPARVHGWVVEACGTHE